MSKFVIQTIALGSLLAISACAKEPATTTDADSAEGYPVGDQLFPATASTTAYTTFGKLREETAVAHRPVMDVALGYSGAHAGRTGVEIRVGAIGQRDARPVVLADGRPSIRPDLPPGTVDLLELLPPAGSRLALHKSYESPAPDTDYILAEADKDRAVMWQQLIQEPVAIVTVGDKTLVRVQGRAVNRMHFVDDDGSLRASDLGAAYLNVADLVNIPGQGWQVLRFARITDVEGATENPDMDLATARAHKHAEFVACASRMDVAAADLSKLHAVLADQVPELDQCNHTKE